MRTVYNSMLLILAALTFVQCGGDSNNSDNKKAEKMSANDPFKNTMVESEFFEFSAEEDKVIEGKKGTVIAFPKGSLLDNKGKVYEGKVKVELAEAYSMADMVQSNLTMDADGKSMETAGVFFIEVTKPNGQKLKINPKNKVRAEIPTNDKKAGMQVYNGTRDKDGKMSWTSPIPLETYLTTVDFADLDFLPEGFATEVQKRIPFKGYTMATQALNDSLYYALGGVTRTDIYNRYRGLDLDLNFNEDHHYINGKSTLGKRKGKGIGGAYYPNENPVRVRLIQDAHHHSESSSCGIDPTKIKTLKDPRFAQTFIATRAFEKRLKVIFKTCRDEILELYVNNLGKNLWEVDEMAANYSKVNNLEFDPTKGQDSTDGNYLNVIRFENEFRKFAEEKLTNVKDAKKNAYILRNYYQHRLRINEAKINQANQKLRREVAKEVQATEKKVKTYKKLLWKREKYRMETYGFDFDGTGWKGVAKPVVVKKKKIPTIKVTGPAICHTIGKLTVEVGQANTFDQTYVYVVYKDIQSMRRLDAEQDGKTWSTFGSLSRQGMLLYNNKPIALVGVAYKGETPYVGVMELMTAGNPNANCNQGVTINLRQTTKEALRKTLKKHDGYGAANRISKDLDYQVSFALAKKRQEKLRDDRDFTLRLWDIANPCCNYYLGEGYD